MKLKKILALTLAAAMTLSLTACGGSAGTSTETPAKEEDGGAKTDDTAPADDSQPAAPAAGDLTYASVTLGESYTDITTTIKFIHHKTDREEDGTIPSLIAKFNEMYPNITVETEGITDYAEDSLLRLSTGDWGDIMFIPAIGAEEFSTYYVPFGTVEEMSQFVNFADNKKFGDTCYGIGYMGKIGRAHV